MKLKDRKIIVVGGGLSGVCIAIRLIRAGVHVTLIDRGQNHSSAVAAGIINPIVFRRMTKSWRVDEFLPALTDFYGQLEHETDSTFLHPLAIRRLFSSIQERNFWIEKQSDAAFQPYLFSLTEDDMNYDGAINEFGSGRLKNAYYVDVKTFLSNGKGWIQKKGEIIEEEFDYSSLQANQYKEKSFDDIVFCEGYENFKNPWFGNLPLDQTKGQTLTIHSEQLPTHVSLNRKCFVLPLEDQQFKIGSTYEWHDPSTNVTESAKKEILENLRYITDEQVTVLSQEAGVRPTTRDRRPLMGTHPTLLNYHIFNGLGAKGYMLCPLLSEEFVHYLSGDKTLDKEVNILRYINK